jgi:hypothetical protein
LIKEEDIAFLINIDTGGRNKAGSPDLLKTAAEPAALQFLKRSVSYFWRALGSSADVVCANMKVKCYSKRTKIKIDQLFRFITIR